MCSFPGLIEGREGIDGESFSSDEGSRQVGLPAAIPKFGRQGAHAAVTDGAENDDSVGASQGSGAPKPPSSSGKDLKDSKAGALPESRSGLQCRGCWKKYSQEHMYPMTSFCRGCKKAYDALAKMAQKQQQLAWWQVTRNSPKDLKRVLARFKQVCPDLNCGRGKKRGHFCVAAYLEEVRIEKDNEIRRRGEYMSKKDFLGFAQAPPPSGWGLAEEAARTHWAEVVGDSKNKPIVVRRGGQAVQLYRVQVPELRS